MTTSGNHFELFGLPISYRIDLASLDAAYERLSMEHHPDFFTTASQEQQAASQQITARINEGYRVLRSDSERGAYLLELLRGGLELDTNHLPEGFLQEMFMLQEEVDDLNGDADEDAREKLKSQVAQQITQVMEVRAGLFQEVEESKRASASDALQALQSNLNCEKYLRRLETRLD